MVLDSSKNLSHVGRDGAVPVQAVLTDGAARDRKEKMSNKKDKGGCLASKLPPLIVDGKADGYSPAFSLWPL